MNKKFVIDNNNLFELNLNESSIVTIILSSDENNINYNLSNGDYKILFFVNNKNNSVINETGSINNANVEIHYVELNDHDLIEKTSISLNDRSTLNIESIYLGINKKDVIFDLTNNCPDTNVNISNNVVCLDKSNISLKVIGNITKGAKRSTCHQKTRCLTIDDPKRCEVLPILNIDENDVEASHSLSSGTIDDDVLFYMNSRGLTKKDALLIMVISYLLPREDIFNDFIDGKLLFNEAERRVKEICLM